jgi:hypothetical protein
MKHVPVSYKVPPDLIAAYERERTEVVFEPGDLENAKEPESVVDAAEYFLIESDTNREMWEDLDASAQFELMQRKGTTVLYVIEVSDDGKSVTYTTSDGRRGAMVGQPVTR